MLNALSSKPSETPQKKWTSLNCGDVIEKMTTAVLVADASYEIIFANSAAIKMLGAIEPDIRKKVPDFQAAKIVGVNIDVFHQNPAYQRGLLKDMRDVHDAGIAIGGVSLDFSVTPFHNKASGPEFYMVELRDVTAEKTAQQKNSEAAAQSRLLLECLNEMAAKHDAGDIDFFVDPARFDRPELQDTAQMVNEMVRSHLSTQENALSVISEFARGNFDAAMARQPGKKVLINEILDNARASFRATTAEIKRLCSAMESGDLQIEVNLNQFDGEYREVLSDFDKAFGALNQAFATIVQQVEQVSSSITQMSTASKTLSSNSQITSASVEEVSASVAETDQQVRANAEASRRASDLVVNATQYTDQGSNKVREMVDSMHGIKSSSQDIAKIIKVIDEIAFQTNLLALNAAVEAARAGQHGRGFAVVAQEVRNLAGRSAKAARETSQLIDDATQRVNSGVLIADETREAFVGISEQISQVKDIVEEIDRSSAEQSRGVAQISLSMSEISNAASETSKQADELAAGSDEMTNATRQMKAEIDRYKLRSTETDSTSDILANLSPEMLAQLQQMVSTKPANGYANGASSKLLDQDARGYGSF